MPLLKKLESERQRRRELLRLATRDRLREVLDQLAPGEKVIVFGSLIRAHSFHERSDVDLAFLEEPRNCSRFQMQARLEERLERPVDLVVLPESRLREKISREGELWTS